MLRYRTVVILIFSLTAVLACGKKEWPSPIVKEEVFSLQVENATRVRDCLQVQARVSGRADNLSAVVLEAEDIGKEAACPTCPFQATQSFTLSRNSAQMDILGDILHLQVCGLDLDSDYRFRILGKNIHSQINDAETRVFSPEKKRKE
ncbi:MAG: hypothetical protein ACLFSY_08895 [Desulfonatronovibrionaceae bacterium]